MRARSLPRVRRLIVAAVSCAVLAAGCGGRTPASPTTASPTTAVASTVTPTTATPTTAGTSAPASTTTTTAVASTSATSVPVATSASPTTGAGATTTTGADPVATITTNWERFFLPSTSIDDRVKLLENGESLRPALEMRATDPLQAMASAHVDHVDVTSADHATVTYDVLLSGTVALTAAQGTAVLQDGVWKVSADSFCALITLGATSPIPGCS